VHIYWSTNHNNANRAASYWVDLDFRLAATMLALSGAVFIFALLSTICSGCAFSIGSSKAKVLRGTGSNMSRAEIKAAQQAAAGAY